MNPKYTAQLMRNDNFYKNELKISNARIKYLDKMIKKIQKCQLKKINMINELKKLYTTREKYFEGRSNDPGSKEAINLMLLDNEIRKLEDEFRNQKGSGTFIYQNKFLKLLTLLTQLLTKNNSKKLKDDINTKRII